MVSVSIMGDSISTFDGYNPPHYAVFYDKEKQTLHGLTSVYDTWWAKVNQALQACLCVNNSYSGSKVSGKRFPAGDSDERIRCLSAKDSSPDYILIYLGFNDFGNGIIPVRSGSGASSINSRESFAEAYDNMLKSIKACYPAAIIVCGTLMRTKIKGYPGWRFPEDYAGFKLEDYNEIIRAVTRMNGCCLADVARKGEAYETLDGSHPTAQGHRAIAAAWIRCLYDLCLIDGV